MRRSAIAIPRVDAVPSHCLTRDTLRSAVSELCARDDDLGRVVTATGPPPLWARPPGFATLVRIVLEQQVSLASARATFRRLQSAAGRVTATRVARLSPATLRRHGITRQKAEYVLDLARAIVAGELNLRAITHADDGTVRHALLAIRGIGPWTADIYLLMALRRPDVWPDGDLALRSATQGVKRLRVPPTEDRLRRMAARWRPWRSVAARILWHHYLSVRRRST